MGNIFVLNPNLLKMKISLLSFDREKIRRPVESRGRESNSWQQSSSLCLGKKVRETGWVESAILFLQYFFLLYNEKWDLFSSSTFFSGLENLPLVVKPAFLLSSLSLSLSLEYSSGFIPRRFTGCIVSCTCQSGIIFAVTGQEKHSNIERKRASFSLNPWYSWTHFSSSRRRKTNNREKEEEKEGERYREREAGCPWEVFRCIDRDQG